MRNTKYLMREILIKDKESGLENEEGRALNKSKCLTDLVNLFKLQESIIGSKRQHQALSLKRPCDPDGDDRPSRIAACQKI